MLIAHQTFLVLLPPLVGAIVPAPIPLMHYWHAGCIIQRIKNETLLVYYQIFVQTCILLGAKCSHVHYWPMTCNNNKNGYYLTLICNNNNTLQQEQ
jgi:hypothetical protein